MSGDSSRAAGLSRRLTTETALPKTSKRPSGRRRSPEPLPGGSACKQDLSNGKCQVASSCGPRFFACQLPGQLVHRQSSGSRVLDLRALGLAVSISSRSPLSASLNRRELGEFRETESGT